MAIKNVNWYRCITVPEINAVEDEENEMNAFISYTFGNKRTRNMHLYAPRISRYNSDEWNEWTKDRYDFKANGIYKVIGKNIIDDSGISHKLEKIKNYFEEFKYTLDEEAKALIKKKEEKGDKIEIKPIMLSQKQLKVVFEISCEAVIANPIVSPYPYTREYETTYDYDIYRGIVRCYKVLRTKNQNYNKLKKLILSNERIR